MGRRLPQTNPTWTSKQVLISLFNSNMHNQILHTGTACMWDTLLSHAPGWTDRVLVIRLRVSPPLLLHVESTMGMLLSAFWSRWSWASSVQQGRSCSPRGTAAICYNPLLFSHITQGPPRPPCEGSEFLQRVNTIQSRSKSSKFCRDGPVLTCHIYFCYLVCVWVCVWQKETESMFLELS